VQSDQKTVVLLGLGGWDSPLAILKTAGDSRQKMFSQVAQSNIRKPVVQKDRCLTSRSLAQDPQVPRCLFIFRSFLGEFAAHQQSRFEGSAAPHRKGWVFRRSTEIGKLAEHSVRFDEMEGIKWSRLEGAI
jgi:hypothetical protein